MKRPGLLLWLWAIFLIRGLFYVSSLPLWEGFDEWAHYAAIQNLAVGGHALMGRNERVSREVQGSLELVPGPGRIDSGVTYDAYWRLPDQERAERQRRLRSMPMQWARDPAAGGARAYEAQQTPLYYWLFTPVYRLTAGLSFLTRVWLFRMLGLCIASAVIPAGFVAARETLGDEFQALGAVALIVAMPQLMMVITRISDDSLAVPMGSLLLVALLLWSKDPFSMSRVVTLGAVLGLALLTKATFLAFVPPTLLYLAFWAKRRNAYGQALVVAALAGSISIWWYMRNWRLTHSFSGNELEVAGGNAGASLLHATLHMNWLKAADFTFLSHVWLGNWSFLVVRSWTYHVFAIFAALALLGVIVRLVQQRKHAEANLLLLCGIYISYLAALAYHAIRTFQSTGFSGTVGYYSFPIVTTEAILLLIGFETLLPRPLDRAVIPGGVVCFAALECFGVNFYALAYYTGFIERLPNGGLPTLKLGQMKGTGFPLMFARLAMNKPEFLNATVIFILWALFAVATAGLVILAIRISARAARQNAVDPG